MSAGTEEKCASAMIESYRIVDEQDDTVDIGGSLRGSVVEQLATRYARQLVAKPIPHDQAFLRTNASLLSQLPEFDEIMKLTLQDAADRLVSEASDELGFMPLDDPYVRLLDGDLDDTLDVMVTIPVLQDAPSLRTAGLSVRYHPVVKSGEEVDERIEEACAQFQVEDAEALISKTGLYASVDQMRAALEDSLDAYIAGLTERSKREAACDALLEAHAFEVPEKLLESYIDREMRGIVGSMGQDAFADQLKAQGLTEEGFREDAASQLVDSLRLEIILDALAVKCEHLVTDEERMAKIAEHVGREGVAPDARADAADEMLRQIKEAPARLRSLDKAVRRDVALDAVLAQADLVELAPMTSAEFVRLDRASLPRI